LVIYKLRHSYFYLLYLHSLYFKNYSLKIDRIELQISKAKKGSQAAFRFLLDTFWTDVYNFQLKRTRSENDAEDITIQTFSKAFDKIATFDEKYVFKTWLITISKNVHIDLLRKKKSSITTETSIEQEETVYLVADENPTPEDKIIGEQNLAKLLRDIKQLKPKYQEVIQLRYFKELTYKEISTEIKEPMNNVKVKLLRAKKLLAAIIKKS
jgi:RNA polymerase sigma factor (sigma-70 family)